MKNKMLQLAHYGIIGFLAVMLTGCFLADKSNSQTQRQQQCSNLKNQLVFGDANSMADTATNKDSTATITAKTMKQYDEKKCSDFETNNNGGDNQPQK